MNAECQTAERRVFYRYEEIDETLGADEVEILSTTREADPPKADEPTETVVVKDGFWRRQFGTNVTAKQRGFDWVMGVFLPIACFVFDPIVFKSSGGFGRPLFGTYSVFASLLAVISIVAMVGWLTFGNKLKWLNGVFAGLFFAGSIVSFALGLVLIPYSLMGIVMLIGFLGFTPLLSTIVYSRNAVRAARSAEPFFEMQTLKYVAMLTGIFTLVLPWIVNQAGK